MAVSAALLDQLPDDLMGVLFRQFLGSDVAANLDRESVQAVGQFVGFVRQWLATSDIVSVNSAVDTFQLILANGDAVPLLAAQPEPQRINSYYAITPPIAGKQEPSIRAHNTVNIFSS